MQFDGLYSSFLNKFVLFLDAEFVHRMNRKYIDFVIDVFNFKIKCYVFKVKT